VGSSGSDTLTGTPVGDKIVLSAVNAGTINATTSFTNFENVGGAAGNDTLTGANGSNVWVMTGAGNGTYNGTLTFSNIQNLNGGTDTDNFNFDNGSVTGNVIGGSNSDRLTVTGSVNLLTNVATSIGGKFSGFETYVGTGTFTAANSDNLWRLTGLNVGTLNTSISFSGFTNYIGGAGNDRLFVNTGRVSGTFNAGSGQDVLDYTGVAMSRPYIVSSATLANGNVRSGLEGNPLMAILGFEAIESNM
jgi:hypothetical protein